MTSKHYIKNVNPNIDLLGNVEIAVGDVIFDWTPFEIPRGTAALTEVTAKVAGLNGADVTGARDIELYFAKSVSGAAPPTLGDTGSATTGIVTTAARPYFIGHNLMDGSGIKGGANLISWSHWSMSGKAGNDVENVRVLLENEDIYPGTTPGYQTIWVAGLAATDVFDFGTDVALNQAGHQAIDTSAVDLVTSGTDPRLVFAIGDEVVSFVASDGSSPKQVGTVTAIADNVSLEVDAVAEAFNHTTELCNRNPIKFKFGFTY